jgi:hypothetical protein
MRIVILLLELWSISRCGSGVSKQYSSPSIQEFHAMVYRLFLLFLIFLLVPAASSAQQPVLSESAESRLNTGRYLRVIVELAPPENDQLLTPEMSREVILNNTFGGVTPENEIAGFGRFIRSSEEPLHFVAELSRSAIERLLGNPDVAAIREDLPHVFATQQIGDNVGVAPLRAEGFDGAGLIFALLDTGVDLVHPFYRDRLLDGACFSTPSGNAESLCPNGEAIMIGGDAARACEGIAGCEHGTAAAGVMIGSNADLVGVAPAAQLVPIQIFTRVSDPAICGDDVPCLRAWSSDIEEAVRWLNNHEDDSFFNIRSVLVNTPPFYDADFDSEWVYSYSDNYRLRDAHFFMPAGNDGTVRRMFTDRGIDASNSIVHVIQALDNDGQIAEFSNDIELAMSQGLFRAAVPRMAAPGVDIATSLPGGEMGNATGTSIAAAQVAAGFALLSEMYPYSRPSIGVSYGNDTVPNPFSNTSIHIFDAGRAAEWIDANLLGFMHLGDVANFFKHYLFAFLGEDAVIFEGAAGGPFLFQNGNERTYASLRIENRENRTLNAVADAGWLDASIRVDPGSGNITDYYLDMAPNALASNFDGGVYEARIRVTMDGERYANVRIALIINDGGAGSIETAPWLVGRRDDGFQVALPDGESQWWRWTAPEDGLFLVRAAVTEFLGPEGIESQLPVSVGRRGSNSEYTPVDTSSRCLVNYGIGRHGVLSPHVQRFQAVAGQEYAFSYPATDYASRIYLRPSLNVHTDVPDNAVLIAGSESATPVTLGISDTLCAPSPRNVEGFIYGPDSAWFRFRPDQSGTHAVWAEASYWFGYMGGRNHRAGIVSIYDSDRSSLLDRFDGRQYDIDGSVAAVADLQAGEEYWLFFESLGGNGYTLFSDGPSVTVGPANDNFENSSELVYRNHVVTGNNRYASREGFSADVTGIGKSLWWHFSPDISGMLLLDLRATFQGEVALYSGAAADELSLVDASAQPYTNFSVNYPIVYEPIQAGETYFIRLDSTQARSGTFEFLFAYGERPDNDHFENARRIELHDEFSGTTRYASHQPGEPIETGMTDFLVDEAERGVWYSFTAPASARYQLWVRSPDINPQIGVYQGQDVAELTYVTHDVHQYGGPPAIDPYYVGFQAVAGEEYMIRISAFGTQMGTFELGVIPGAPANDDNRQPIVIELPSAVFVDRTDNRYSNHQGLEETTIGDTQLTGSLWYLLGGEGNWVVDTSGSSIDTIIYRGCCRSYQEHNDDEGEGVFTSRLMGSRSFGDLYTYIGVSGVNGARGDIRVNIGAPEDIRPRIGSALLPYARSSRVGEPVTTFATILNGGFATGRECGLSLLDPSMPLEFEFFPTDAATNTISGGRDETQLIEAGRYATYLLSFTPTAALTAQDIDIEYTCDGGSSRAVSIRGVNTFFLSAENAAVPDVLAIAATVGNTGVMEINNSNQRGFFTTAAINIGDADSITFSADTGTTELPIELVVCETDLSQGGTCVEARSNTVTVNMRENQARTFAIFAVANDSIPFSPRTNRVFARWRDSDGVVRGATSVAVRTQ